jgi:hypothetical protein
MQPRFTTQSSEARSWTMGKSMTLADWCSIEHSSIQGGRGAGARFMKKNAPLAPSG